jgi:Tfp pilus assembly PilM family ATPase
MLTDTLAKHFNVSPEEAESMKKEIGLRRNTSDQELFGLLLNNIAVLRDEVNRNFLYWHTHPDEHGKTRPAVESVYLVGGDANLSGLSDYLTSSLRVKTTVADVWVNAGLPAGEIPEISKMSSLGYATALGLALRTIDHE